MLHKLAVGLWGRLKSEGHRIVISNFIISEVITVLSQRAGKTVALEFADAIYGQENNEVKIIRLDEDLELAALKVIKGIQSKNVSFVDATIFAILERYKIHHLASFDAIFRRLTGVQLY